jgi:pSer/pThr/pTyr-binding forkhead associated (FHA) protein
VSEDGDLPAGAFLFDGFQAYPLEGPVTSLGRSFSVDGVVLEDELVSRRHAWLLRGEDGSWLLLDRGSSNGTRVGGRLVDRHLLEDLDEIRVGDTRLVFRNPLAPVEAKKEDSQELEQKSMTLGRSLLLQQSRLAEIFDAGPQDAVHVPGIHEDPGFDRLKWIHSGCRSLFEFSREEDLREHFVELVLGGTGACRGLLIGARGTGDYSILVSRASGELDPWRGIPTGLFLALGIALRSQHLEVFGDVSQDARLQRGAVVLENIQSALVLPILNRGRSPTLLVLDHRIQFSGSFGRTEIQALFWLAASFEAAMDLLGEPS